MSELSTRVELDSVADSKRVLLDLASRHEHVLKNLSVLGEILDQSKNSTGRIYVETLSQARDIGGIFMDEPHSNPRYRDYIFVGEVNHGDALAGESARLVTRKNDGKDIVQIEVDFGDSGEPILGYFNLEDTLHGCSIRN